MTAPSSATGGLPVPPDELLSREISPAEREIAFVRDLVQDDRLAPFLPPGVRVLCGPVVVGLLQARVGDPLGRSCRRRSHTDGSTGMSVRIQIPHECSQPVPVVIGLGHQVVLVGQRPPDVGKGRQARDDVPQVMVVRLRAHRGVAPAIVGMEQDEIGNDPQVTELGYAVLQVAEEVRVGPLQVVAAPVAHHPDRSGPSPTGSNGYRSGSLVL